MNQKYRHKHTSVSLVNYRFCWIVCRRRKVLTGSIKQRLDILIHDAARELDCEVLSLAIEPEHVHLFLNCPPNMAPSDVMHRIKGRTARFLRKEFPELMKFPSMWTRAKAKSLLLAMLPVRLFKNILKLKGKTDAP